MSIISSTASCLSENLSKCNTSKAAASTSCILLHLLQLNPEMRDLMDISKDKDLRIFFTTTEWFVGDWFIWGRYPIFCFRNLCITPRPQWCKLVWGTLNPNTYNISNFQLSLETDFSSYCSVWIIIWEQFNFLQFFFFFFFMYGWILRPAVSYVLLRFLFVVCWDCWLGALAESEVSLLCSISLLSSVITVW